MKHLLSALLLLTFASLPVRGQTSADSTAIREAVLDYIDGWYSGDAERMARAVHPQLVKRIVRTDNSGGSVVNEMDAATLIQGTRQGGGRSASNKRSDVRILDVYGNAAAVRIDAGDWVDYLQLGRFDGRWMIVNVLWELRPGK